MTADLRIAPDLRLPLDVVTSTCAILAQKGAGKSYTASVIAEELLDARQQVVVLDPTGAWWGLRAAADGKGPGHSIVVLGGDHGDLPLDVGAGELLADAIAAEHFSCVIDLSRFRKGEVLRFCTAFLETLYRVNRAPLHLVIDEADVVAPQKARPESARCLGAAEDIVRRGRIRGIGCTLITQRPQALNKDVLTQADMLTVLRLSHPRDLAAIMEWINVHAEPGEAAAMLKSLPSLPTGEAWFWAPRRELLQRVKVRARRTFDSGRTPRAGERIAAPKVLAPVDLERLGATMAAAVERAKESDPKALRLEVQRLRAELAKKPAAVDQTAIDRAVRDANERAREHHLRDTRTTLGAIETEVLAAIRRVGNLAVGAQREPAAVPTIPPLRPRAAAPPDPRPPLPAGARPPARLLAANAAGVTGPEQRILDALAWWSEMGVDVVGLPALAFLADYSPKTSGFIKARGLCHGKGLVAKPGGDATTLTDAGRALASPVDVPRTNAGLQEAVLRKLPGPERKLLAALLEHGEMTREQLAEATNYSNATSGYIKARGSLVSLGLAVYPTSGRVAASAILYPESS
jgi:hypothetical protein